MARQKARNVKQVKAEIFDDGDDPNNVPARGLGWLLFRAPGALFLWWQYYNAKSGNVLLSGRQKGNVAMEVLFSIIFWVGAAILSYVYFARGR